MKPPLPASESTMLKDERGAVLPEYAIVMVLVSVPVALAVAALGLPLISHLRFAQTLIGMPIP